MRRNGFKIMANLFALVGSFMYVLVLAVFNGSLGFLFAMSLTILGTVALAQLLGAFTGISLTLILSLIIVFGVMVGVLKCIEQYSNHYIAFKLLAILRDKVFTQLRKLCPAKLETKQKGSIISMITADIETLEVFYAHTMSPICIAVVVSVVMTTVIGVLSSWYLALYAILAYCILGVVMPLLSSKFLRESGVEYRTKFSKFNGFFMDTIRGNKEIMLYGKEKQKTNEVTEFSNTLNAESQKLSRKMAIFEAINLSMITILNSIMITLAITMYINNVIDIGGMLVAIVSLMSSFGAVLALGALPNDLNHTFASGERVMSLMEEIPAVSENTNGKTVYATELTIKNLEFSYNDDAKVLNNISLNVKVGEIVGLQGKSGCGKSTLLKLIMRFWDKQSGDILLDNIDIADINNQSLKNNITMVSQSTYLFNETVRENLLIAKPDATDEEIIKACKKASIHDFILTLPNGYDTVIGKKEIDVSTGEAQRIGLARAFLRESKFILLDEPTSNVDSINEGVILKALKDNARDKGVILVSHRESTMSICDRVYKFNDGKITQ